MDKLCLNYSSCSHLSLSYLSARDVIDKAWDFKRPYIFFSLTASNKKHLSNIQDFHDITLSKVLDYLLGNQCKEVIPYFKMKYHSISP